MFASFRFLELNFLNSKISFSDLKSLKIYILSKSKETIVPNVGMHRTGSSPHAKLDSTARKHSCHVRGHWGTPGPANNEVHVPEKWGFSSTAGPSPGHSQKADQCDKTNIKQRCSSSLESSRVLHPAHTQFCSSLFSTHFTHICPRQGCINSDLPKVPPCVKAWSLSEEDKRVVVVTSLLAKSEASKGSGSREQAPLHS